MAPISTNPVLYVSLNDEEFDWVRQVFQDWAGVEYKEDSLILTGGDEWDDLLNCLDAADVPKFAERFIEELQQHRRDQLDTPDDILFCR